MNEPPELWQTSPSWAGAVFGGEIKRGSLRPQFREGGSLDQARGAGTHAQDHGLSPRPREGSSICHGPGRGGVRFPGPLFCREEVGSGLWGSRSGQGCWKQSPTVCPQSGDDVGRKYGCRQLSQREALSVALEPGSLGGWSLSLDPALSPASQSPRFPYVMVPT